NGCPICDSRRVSFVSNVLGMSKATRKIDEHAAQLARVRRICSELDDVREESERLRRGITSEVRGLSEAASTPEQPFTTPSTSPVPAAARRYSRIVRNRAN